MEGNDNYSLINVVRHMNYCMEKNNPNHHLILQYKFAKPNEQVEGNKKFQKILEKSFDDVIVMNANRQMKKKPYVHLKSMTYPDQFKWFEKNLESLQKIVKTQKKRIQKLDINTKEEKITYDSLKQRWYYKGRVQLFRPNYETVKDGKLFRISLRTQSIGDYEPKKKVQQILNETIEQYLSYKKSSQKKKLQSNKTDDNFSALRFKLQRSYQFDQYFELVLSQVYQVVDQKLYRSILDLVNNKKNSNAETIGREILSELVKDILHEQDQEYGYQVELKFLPVVFEDFQDMKEEEIEQIMEIALQIFVVLSRDPHQFSAQEVLQLLNQLDEK